MKKDLGIRQAVYPMPVLMIATYDENGTVDVMNAAWGMISKADQVTLFISERHKTVENLRKTKAFTVSLANEATLAEADYFGIASGNDTPDKFERTGMTAVKSDRVNAPVVTEFPVTIECELDEIIETEKSHAVVGKIVNVLADEEVLDEDDNIVVEKLGAVAFDNAKHGYYRMGERIAFAWDIGNKFN